MGRPPLEAVAFMAGEAAVSVPRLRGRGAWWSKVSPLIGKARAMPPVAVPLLHQHLQMRCKHVSCTMLSLQEWLVVVGVEVAAVQVSIASNKGRVVPIVNMCMHGGGTVALPVSCSLSIRGVNACPRCCPLQGVCQHTAWEAGGDNGAVCRELRQAVGAASLKCAHARSSPRGSIVGGAGGH